MTEWGSVVDWASLVVLVVLNVLTVVGVLWFMRWYLERAGAFMSGVLGSGTASMRDGQPTVKSMMCKHRYLARVRNAYGRNYTACVRCGLDVNRGKVKELRR